MVGINQRARDEGRQEGVRVVLERQLRRRFGTLPPAVGVRLGAASEADLEAWADNVLDAATLDDVFEPGRTPVVVHAVDARRQR